MRFHQPCLLEDSADLGEVTWKTHVAVFFRGPAPGASSSIRPAAAIFRPRPPDLVVNGMHACPLFNRSNYCSSSACFASVVMFQSCHVHLHALCCRALLVVHRPDACMESWHAAVRYLMGTAWLFVRWFHRNRAVCVWPAHSAPHACVHLAGFFARRDRPPPYSSTRFLARAATKQQASICMPAGRRRGRTYGTSAADAVRPGLVTLDRHRSGASSACDTTSGRRSGACSSESNGTFTAWMDMKCMVHAVAADETPVRVSQLWVSVSGSHAPMTISWPKVQRHQAPRSGSEPRGAAQCPCVRASLALDRHPCCPEPEWPWARARVPGGTAACRGVAVGTVCPSCPPPTTCLTSHTLWHACRQASACVPHGSQSCRMLSAACMQIPAGACRKWNACLPVRAPPSIHFGHWFGSPDLRPAWAACELDVTLHWWPSVCFKGMFRLRTKIFLCHIGCIGRMSSRDSQLNCVISLFFYLHLIFYACV